LIISDVSGTYFGGEGFHTLNRLHSQINEALKKQGVFIQLTNKTIEIGKQRLSFALNKNTYIFLLKAKPQMDGSLGEKL
jgi:hypothetical protein